METDFNDGGVLLADQPVYANFTALVCVKHHRKRVVDRGGGLLRFTALYIFFLTFGYTNANSFRFILYAVVSIIGLLSGLEVPMLLRILKDKLEFKELLSQVLSLDYIGSLIASLLFPLFFVPYLGLIRTSAFFGFVNVLVAIGFLYLFLR